MAVRRKVVRLAEAFLDGQADVAELERVRPEVGELFGREQEDHPYDESVGQAWSMFDELLWSKPRLCFLVERSRLRSLLPLPRNYPGFPRPGSASGPDLPQMFRL